MKRLLASRSLFVACLAVSLLLAGCDGSSNPLDKGQPQGRTLPIADMPTFIPPGDTYDTPVAVTISSTAQGATLYYTTDGTDPSNTRGTLYTSPIQVAVSTSLKAIAYTADGGQSAVGVAIYVIAGNKLPVLADGSITGDLRPNHGTTITVSCTATDPDGYIKSVVADLTSLGGTPNQPLIKTQGNTWSWTGTVRPTSAGTKQVGITATDDKDAVSSIQVQAVAASPIGTEIWQVLTEGPILSSPAIAKDGTVYVGSTDKNLYAVNPDGSLRWAFNAGGAVAGSPAVGEDGTIYIGAGSHLHAVNSDGTTRWSYPSKSGVIYSAPAIGVRGTIYVGTFGGFLLAINSDGTPQWQANLGTNLQAAPSIDKDGTIYIGGLDGTLFAVYASGRVRWSYKTGGTIVGSPAIGLDGTIYIGSTDSRIYALRPDGTEKWTSKRGGAVTTSPAITADGFILVGSANNRLSALDAAMGALEWEFLAGSPVVGSPTVAADGTIYIGCNDGMLYAVDAAGREVWHFETTGQLLTSPAVAPDGSIYLGGTDKRLYAVAGSKGLADSPWPTYRANLQRTGAVASLTISNIVPKIFSPAAQGRLVEQRTGSLKITCTAMDVDTTVLPTVMVDLSPLGGQKGTVLSKAAGDDWSWTGNITVPKSGIFPIQLTATDADGGAATTSVDVRVLAKPAITDGSVSQALSRKQAQDVTISCTATDADGTIQSVVADLSSLGGPANAGLVKVAGNVWSWSGTLTPANIGQQTITFTATDNEGVTESATMDVSVANSRPTIGSPTIVSTCQVGGQTLPILLQDADCNLTITCTPVDVDGTVSSVVADLGAIKDAASVDLAKNPDGTWSWSGTLTPGKFGKGRQVILRATDSDSDTAELVVPVDVLKRPAIDRASLLFVGQLIAGTQTTVSVSCKVRDLDGTVAKVVVDLSAMGGGAAEVMQLGADDRYTWEGSVLPATGGPKVMVFTATDNDGLEDQARLGTHDYQGTLAKDTVCDFTASWSPVAEPGRTITRVTLDLGQISSLGIVDMQAQPGGSWRWTGQVVPPTAGQMAIYFHAYDNAGVELDYDAASPMVYLPPFAADMSVSGTFMRMKTTSNVTVSCRPGAVDATVTSVQVDLSPIGDMSIHTLTDQDGDGTYTWTGSVTPTASVGTHGVLFIVEDSRGARAPYAYDVTIDNSLPTFTNTNVLGTLGRDYASTITVTCAVVDANGSVAAVTADLSAVGGPVAQPLGFAAGKWTWTGKVTPTATGWFDVIFTATDNDGGQTSETWTGGMVTRTPEIADLAMTPSYVAVYSATDVTITCTPSDPDGDSIQAVRLDLSMLGGPNNQLMTEVGDGSWTWQGTVYPVFLGQTSLTATAVDSTGLPGSSNLVVPLAPAIVAVAHSGTLIDGQASTLTVTCRVVDDGSISSLVVDVSTVGTLTPGSAVVTRAGDQWTWKGTVTPDGYGTRTVTVTATDNAGYDASASAQVQVNPAPRWLARWLGGPTESSPAIASDGTIYIGSSDNNLYAVNSADGADAKAPLGLGGLVYSSPCVAADGTVYVGSGDKKLYAVKDGAVAWSFTTNGRVTSSPAISADGAVVYVGSEDNKVYAIDVATRAKPAAWAGPFSTGGKVVSSPAISSDGQLLFVGSYDKKVYAIKTADGQKQWEVLLPGPVASSPAIGSDGTVYVACNGGLLYALNPADGSAVWATPFSIGGLYAFSSPAIAADGTIYIGSEADGGKVYAVSPAGAKVWECAVSGEVRSCPAIGSDGLIYVGTQSGAVLAIDAAAGLVQWTFQTGAEVRSSPALDADGTLYVASYDGYLYAIKASGQLDANAAWPMFRAGLDHQGRAN